MSAVKNSSLSVLKSIGLIAIDAVFAALAMLLAIRWRYDVLGKAVQVSIDLKAAIIAAAVTLVIWAVMRQDRAIWRFTSLSDFRRLLLGLMIVIALVPLVLFFLFDRGEHFPRSAPFIGGMFFFGFILASRLLTMIVQNGDIRALFRSSVNLRKKALLIGPAPDLYNYLRDRSRRSEGIGFTPVGLIETSGGYDGRSIRSIPVLGGIDDLATIYSKLAQKMEEKIQLISVEEKQNRPVTSKLIKTASMIGAPLARKTYDVNGKLHPFEAADLIGREMRQLDLDPVKRLIKGRKVLVTGAGGSIGSELSRQLVPFMPEKLILLDQSEFNLFQLEHEMARIVGAEMNWKNYIADVTHKARLAEIFETEKPDMVLHAAAMKHVPLGEENPLETLHTNVIGTKTVLDVCRDNNVDHFILISTDKAVRPLNVMGASKRIVEMLAMSFHSLTPHMYTAAVRFGNVLASRGSVVNLFEEQIMAGGPVTVTHPDVNRYFMMIEEAAALVLQAAAIGSENGGSQSDATIYVLEMGEPVNIAHLARQLIRLRGMIPDIDIKVEYTGLRPGEKLTEILTHSHEELTATHIDGVQKLNAATENPKQVLKQVDALITAIEVRDKSAIVKALKSLLPDYDPNGAFSL